MTHNPTAAALDVAAWTTHADQTRLLDEQRDGLTAATDRDAATTIEVRTAERYQTMDGFGFSLTGGSAELIRRLAPGRRQALLHELFTDPPSGIGISYLRLSIGASDLSRASFSYDDCAPGRTDADLAGFRLDAGDGDVIPLIKDILAIRPDLRLLATPWSAPPWMKTNGSFTAGSLRHEHYRSYARYLVAYIQGMRSHGIPIHALTPQNEPLNIKNEPSMAMSAAEQADFIAGHLGPCLRDAGLDDVALLCYDHNCDRPDYPLAVLANARARPFVKGVAWHLYGGSPQAISDVARLHPGLKMYLTEQWVGADGQFGNDLMWHVRNVAIGTIRNGAEAVFEWNLAGDPEHGPFTPGGSHDCVGALTIDGPSKVERNVSYYVIAHLSRFVPPGSTRVFSTAIDALPNAAFATPQGETVLLVLNDAGTAQTFDIRCNGRTVAVTLAGRAVATYVWQTGATPLVA